MSGPVVRLEVRAADEGVAIVRRKLCLNVKLYLCLELKTGDRRTLISLYLYIYSYVQRWIGKALSELFTTCI